AVAQTYAAINRRELPAATTDFVNIDHRRGTLFPGAISTDIRSVWGLAANFSICIETVHRLSNLGAVFTGVGNGTSQDGFDAEWRNIAVVTVDGHLLSRCEIFDQGDIDAALARFDELHLPTPRLENAASQVTERFLAHLAAGDWDAIAETLADDFSQDDR